MMFGSGSAFQAALSPGRLKPELQTDACAPTETRAMIPASFFLERQFVFLGKKLLTLPAALSAPYAAQTAAPHVPVVSAWMILPFVLLLLAIAVAPFVHRH